MGSLVESVEILLLIAALVSILARRLRLPYTVGLVFAGLALAFAPHLPQVRLTQDLVFKALLPPLLFEAAFQIEWKELKRELGVVLLLATVGVLISAALMAAAVHYGAGWAWGSAIVLATLLSATDPVAVISVFKDVGLKGRLAMLLESESLFNDGTAAVLFVIALGVANGGTVSAGNIAGSFLLSTCGGVLCGLLVGGLALLLTGRTDDHLVEIAFTSISAYGAFLLAEHFHLSGVLATLATGLLLGNVGSLGAISDKGREAVESFWEYIAFVANSLIFLLIGVSLATLPIFETWYAAVIVISAMLVSRAVAVYGCCAIFSRTEARVDANCQHVMVWGGLRGALALALVLGLPDTFERRQDILYVTFAAVAFSVILQGLTIKPLMKGFGILGPTANR